MRTRPARPLAVLVGASVVAALLGAGLVGQTAQAAVPGAEALDRYIAPTVAPIPTALAADGYNACTGVPDSWTVTVPVVKSHTYRWGWAEFHWFRVVYQSSLVFDFKPACTAHDLCYIYKQGVPTDDTGRLICDDDFLEDMAAMCSDRSDNRDLCYVAALVYYAGVRVFGEESWQNSSPCTSWRHIADVVIVDLDDILDASGVPAPLRGLLTNHLPGAVSETIFAAALAVLTRDLDVDRCDPEDPRPTQRHWSPAPDQAYA